MNWWKVHIGHKLFGIQFSTKIMEKWNFKWGWPPRPPRSKKPNIYFHFFLNSIFYDWPPAQSLRKRGCAFPNGNIAQEFGMIFFTVFCSILLCNKNSHFTLHKIQNYKMKSFSMKFIFLSTLFCKNCICFYNESRFCHFVRTKPSKIFPCSS